MSEHSEEVVALNRAIGAYRRQWIADHDGREPEDDDTPADESWAYVQEVRRMSGLDPDRGHPVGQPPPVRRRRRERRDT
ncbi:hypothetical protein AB0D49_08210 [Streptomyces sp. NPDC048290]|uniref:hypothetical protein n=1 Tax=Streptomyces sp. NPDC048290 TaxID=3155811 RepID=UPI003414939B